MYLESDFFRSISATSHPSSIVSLGGRLWSNPKQRTAESANWIFGWPLCFLLFLAVYLVPNFSRWLCVTAPWAFQGRCLSRCVCWQARWWKTLNSDHFPVYDKTRRRWRHNLAVTMRRRRRLGSDSRNWNRSKKGYSDRDLNLLMIIKIFFALIT